MHPGLIFFWNIPMDIAVRIAKSTTQHVCRESIPRNENSSCGVYNDWSTKIVILLIFLKCIHWDFALFFRQCISWLFFWSFRRNDAVTNRHIVSKCILPIWRIVSKCILCRLTICVVQCRQARRRLLHGWAGKPSKQCLCLMSRVSILLGAKPNLTSLEPL